MTKESYNPVFSLHTPQQNYLYEKCLKHDIKSKKAAAISKLYGYV